MKLKPWGLATMLVLSAQGVLADPRSDYDQCAMSVIMAGSATTVAEVIAACQAERDALAASLNEGVRAGTLADIDAITQAGLQRTAASQ